MSITPFVPPGFLTSLPTGLWSGADGLAVLPYLPGQAVSVSKAPLWSTKTARATSGRERRTAHWPYPLWQFELAYEVVRHRPTQAELFALWEFFNLAQGQYGPWLFVDPSDCEIAAAAPAPALNTATGTSLGDGVTTSFQLARPINSFVEPVYAAYAPSLVDDGAAAGAWSLGAGGVVTFARPPAAGHAIGWYGYFYFLCRFSEDNATFAQIVQQLWAGKSLKFTSIRP